MRFVLHVLFALIMAGFALAMPIDSRAQGVSIPFCTPDAPDCVIANWGQTEPELTGDSNAMAAARSPLASANARISIRPMPVAMTADAMKKSTPAVKAVTSPVNFAPKETAALVAAIKRARFAKDGTIVSGDKQIAAAAEAVTKKAGKGYTLTLYVKSPPTLKPDAADALAKRVGVVNGILGNPVGSEKPRS
jgi:hypothetical protein